MSLRHCLAGLALFSLMTCSTLQQLEEENRPLALPVLHAQASVEKRDPADFKIRARRGSSIQLVYRLESGGNLAPEIQDLAVSLLLSRMAFPDVKWTPADRSLLPVTAEANRSTLRELAADAYVKLDLVAESAEALVLGLQMLDPYSGAVLGDLKQDFRLHVRTVPARQQDLILFQRQVLFLSNFSGPQLEMLNVRSPQALRELLLTAVTGRLNVSSSAAATEVWSGNTPASLKRLGNTPLENILLDEGQYTLQFRRTGFKNITQSLQVRAGRTESIVVPWPDDPVQHSAMLLSRPVELQVALEGSVRGQTPTFLTGLERGSYALEFSRLNEKENVYEVIGEGTLNVADALTERAYLFQHQETFPADLLQGQLWQLVSERGRTNFQGPGLGIRSDTKDRWMGLRSVPFFIESFDYRLANLESDGGQLLWSIESAGDTLHIEVNGNAYRALHLREGKTIASSPVFRTRLPLANDRHMVRVQYDREKKQVRIKVDGTVMYAGEYLPAAEGRFLLLTRGESTDGRTLAESLTIASGRGIVDNRLVYLPWWDDMVDFLRRK